MVDKSFKLKFAGGTGWVTGANFLLETSKSKILVDCGLVQGGDEAFLQNYEPFPYNPAEIDVLIVSHAHIDHIGRIPKLIQDGFKGKIFSTEVTKEISKPMLEDAFGLLAREAREKKMNPLYEEGSIHEAFSNWEVIEYHSSMDITEDLSIYTKDAGHILGSMITEVTHKPSGKKIAFTGDLGNSPTPLLPDTEMVDVDYLVMESVYGDRKHADVESRKYNLEKMINKGLKRGGTILIPTFSLEKTQVLLREMNDLVEGNKIPSVPVYLDSPLALKITEIYGDHTDLFKKEVREQIKGGDDIFDFPKLVKVYDRKDSEKLHSESGSKIILAGSGMSTGGRILAHEAHYLKDPNNLLILIGFQVPGTLGRRIQDGNKKLKIGRESIVVKAGVEVVSGYSSHRDQTGLLEFVKGSSDRLKKVFCVMGEAKSSCALAQKLRDELDIDSYCPELGEEMVL